MFIIFFLRSYSVVFPLERSPLFQKRGCISPKDYSGQNFTTCEFHDEPFSGILTILHFGRGKRFVEYFIQENVAQHHVLIEKLMSELIPHF